jgi:hypothetical protein
LVTLNSNANDSIATQSAWETVTLTVPKEDGPKAYRPDSKKLVWKSEACGCWWGGASGIHESWVSLIPTVDGRVFLFGSASIGFYAHGFDASNGKPLVRFSNNY